jgi:hypothetical protein
MAPEAEAPDSAGPESTPEPDHLNLSIRRIYQAWVQGDYSSEDALFAIGDALGAQDKGAADDRS